jgi:hypothetical protein
MRRAILFITKSDWRVPYSLDLIYHKGDNITQFFCENVPLKCAGVLQRIQWEDHNYFNQ